jgi:hypothetical protein
MNEYEVVWWVRGVNEAEVAIKVARNEVKKRLNGLDEAIHVKAVFPTGNRYLVVLSVNSISPAYDLERRLHVHVESPRKAVSENLLVQALRG